MSLNKNIYNAKTKLVRIKWTVVPCIKLRLRINRTFFNSNPNIFIVVVFKRFTSCSVNPKLFTNSIFLNDSVVAPAKAVVSPSISRDTFLIFFPKNELINAITGTVDKKIGPSNQWIFTAYATTKVIPTRDWKKF